MPKVLRSILSAEMLFCVCTAIVLAHFKDYPWNAVVWFASAIPFALCLAYWRRFKFADVALQAYCVAAVVMAILALGVQVLSTSRISLSVQNLILVAESALLVVLYGALLTDPVKRWYKSNGPHPS